jgi:hypothetical protein
MREDISLLPSQSYLEAHRETYEGSRQQVSVLNRWRKECVANVLLDVSATARGGVMERLGDKGGRTQDDN